ncbi:MAG: hypothetical protein EP336_10415 [Rhodobacteraceae bacterium]|nr:MAG: hypothetical protein EP336_10415 [Paracoccaceae bacterium]
MSLLGSVVGAVAGPLLGGLFGGNKTTSTSRVDYKYLVNESQKYGFNPLTALRNGGSANATTTTTTPLFSSGDISNAVQTAFNAPALAREEEASKLALEIQKEELKQLKQQTSFLFKENGPYAIPHVSTYGVSDATSSSSVRGGFPPLDVGSPVPSLHWSGGSYVDKDGEKQDVARFNFLGRAYEGSGRTSSGQTVEDAVGDGVASNLLGLGIVGDAFGHSVIQPWLEDRKMRAMYRRYYKSKKPKPSLPALAPFAAQDNPFGY